MVLRNGRKNGSLRWTYSIFLAGARICRTGGDNSHDVMLQYADEPRLSRLEKDALVAGYAAEMKSNPDHRSGEPLAGEMTYRPRGRFS